MNIDQNSLWEALKEPMRLVVLAMIAWILTAVVPQLDEQWVPIITILLKFIDKWLHEVGKTSKDESMMKGLTRF